MKFYTKQWYELMQRLDYCLGMKSIDDAKCTDADIQRLHVRARKKHVKDAEREYNEPPQFVELDFDELDFEEFVFFDVETGKLIKPGSVDEVKRNYEEQCRREYELFESRPPFDRDESLAEFDEMYENRMKYALENYPGWAKSRVDARLAALGYLPKSVYDRLKDESKANKREFDEINRAARKAFAAERKKLPERIFDDFGFHDAELVEFAERDGDFVIVLRGCFACFDGETPYIRVTFRNAKISEADGDAFSDTDDARCCVWLYDELYAVDGGIEAHMLFSSDKTKDGLAYLTLRCADIDVERNVAVDKAPD